jgi:LacI family transcriptional regulator
VTIKPGLEAIRQRLLGYQDALDKFDINPVEKFVKELNPKSYEEEMKVAIGELVRFPNVVDSIVFSTHYLTALGLRELRKFNIKVPQEVAIVSFDEMGAFDLADPPITSVIQPIADIGNLAVDILMNKIEGSNPTLYDKRILETKLTIRRSCGSI